MAYLLTFLEGIITFVSPCILPLLPVYVAYFAGNAGSAGAGSSTRAALVRSLGFVTGFSLLFVVLGVFAGALGAALATYQRALDVVCGAVMVVLGLNYMGVLSISALDRTVGPTSSRLPEGFMGSVVFGLVFGLGWTPCVGTFLASALSMAASSASVVRGVVLLICYSAGLGVPFVLSAVLIDQLEDSLTWIKSHYGLVRRASGALLVLVGLLMGSGLMGMWLRLLAM